MKNSKKVLAILILFVVSFFVFASPALYESRAEGEENYVFTYVDDAEDAKNAETAEHIEISDQESFEKAISEEKTSGGDAIMKIYRSRFFLFWGIGVLLLVLIAYVIFSGNRRRSRSFREQPLPERTAEVEEGDDTLTKRIVLTDMSRPDTRYAIDLGRTTILGRSKSRCDIAFPEYPSMSSRQARIFFDDGKVFLENLDTVESTFLNGAVVKGIEEVPNGALIQLGDLTLKVRYV